MQVVNLLDGTMAYGTRIPAHSAAGNSATFGVDEPISGVAPLRRPEWLAEEQWPFETLGIDQDGHCLALIDVGSGPTLLFVHTGFWSFIWRDVILRLKDSYRCVAIDAPGTGLSSRLPAELVSLDRSAQAVTRVIELLDLKDLVLVIHDLGGPAGIAGAARVAGRVRGIAAPNTFGWRPSNTVFRAMLALMGSAFMREFDVATGMLPRVTSNLFGAGRYLDHKSRTVLQTGIGREGLRAFHYYMRDARSCDDLYQRVHEALTGAFRGLPFLSVFGERNDPFCFQLRWRQLFPHAEQAVIAKGNHFPMCDDPALTATLIRWWHQKHVVPHDFRTSTERLTMERTTMSTARQNSSATAYSRRAAWGRRFIAFSGTAVLISSVVKFLHPPKPLAYLASMGYEGNTVYLIAAAELVIAVLFLVPATRHAGLLLISAFLGGAVAAHVAIHRSFSGGPFITYMAEHPYVGALIPGALLVLAWLGDHLERTGMLLDHSADERQALSAGARSVMVGSNS